MQCLSIKYHVLYLAQLSTLKTAKVAASEWVIFVTRHGGLAESAPATLLKSSRCLEFFLVIHYPTGMRSGRSVTYPIITVLLFTLLPLGSISCIPNLTLHQMLKGDEIVDLYPPLC